MGSALFPSLSGNREIIGSNPTGVSYFPPHKKSSVLRTSLRQSMMCAFAPTSSPCSLISFCYVCRSARIIPWITLHNTDISPALRPPNIICVLRGGQGNLDTHTHHPRPFFFPPTPFSLFLPATTLQKFRFFTNTLRPSGPRPLFIKSPLPPRPLTPGPRPLSSPTSTAVGRAKIHALGLVLLVRLVSSQ